MRGREQTGVDDQQQRSDSILETVESFAKQSAFPLRRMIDRCSHLGWRKPSEIVFKKNRVTRWRLVWRRVQRRPETDDFAILSLARTSAAKASATRVRSRASI